MGEKPFVGPSSRPAAIDAVRNLVQYLVAQSESVAWFCIIQVAAAAKWSTNEGREVKISTLDLSQLGLVGSS